jgi:hypothetical protein
MTNVGVSVANSTRHYVGNAAQQKDISLFFDGINDVCTTPNVGTFNAFTAVVWVRSDNFGSSYRVPMVSTRNGRKFCINTSNNVVDFSVSGDGSSWNLVTHLQGGNIADNKWHHIACVYDGTQGYLYVDKVLKATGGIAGTVNVNTSPIEFGNSVASEVTKQYMRGALFYTRALSQAEINTIYDYEPDTTDTALVGYWSMQEGAGTIVRDLSGHNNHATINGATWIVKDNNKDSVTFDGANGVISFGAPHNYNQVSFETWIVPTDISTYRTLFAKEGQYKFRIQTGGAIGVLATVTASGTWLFNNVWTANIVTNKLYHIVCGIDLVSGTADLFVNGVDMGRKTFTGGTPTFNANPLCFGAFTTGGTSEPFKGQFIEGRLYNRILTGAEVLNNYNHDITSSGLTREWKANESLGAIVRDSSGNKNDGIISGNSSWQKLPKTKSSLSFNQGLSNYVSLGDVGMSALTSCSVEFWHKTSENKNMLVLSNSAASKYILARRSDAVFYHSGATVTTMYRDGAVANDILPDGQWHHYVASGVDLSTFVDLVIGKWSGYYLYGDLAGFKIWNHALTQAEVQANMVKNFTGYETGLLHYWNFEKGKGTILEDLSSAKKHGTIYGAAWRQSREIREILF